MFLENISLENSSFCELTALYEISMMESLSANVGICHYRRFFTSSAFQILFNYNVSVEKMDKILKKNEIILPYCLTFDCNIYDHFANNHNEKDYLLINDIIINLYPNYKDVVYRFQKLIKWCVSICFILI